MSSPDREQYLNAWDRVWEMAGPTVPVRVLAQTGDRWPIEVGTITVHGHEDHSQQVAAALRALADEIAPSS